MHNPSSKTEGGVLFSNLGPFWGFRGIFPKRGPKSKFWSNNFLAMAWGVHSNGKAFLAQKLKEEFHFQCMGHYGLFWTISPKRGPKSKFCPIIFFDMVRWVYSHNNIILAQKLKEEFNFPIWGHFGPFLGHKSQTHSGHSIGHSAKIHVFRFGSKWNVWNFRPWYIIPQNKIIQFWIF